MATIEPYATSTGQKRYRVRYRTPDHRQTDKRGFTTKRDAELFRASLQVRMARGEFIPVNAGRVSIRELAERWRAHQVSQKPATIAANTSALTVHVLPRWADVHAADVTYSDVREWVSRLSRDRGPATVRRAHNVLSMILADAVRDGRLVKNPAEGVPLPRRLRKQRTYLTHGQVNTLATCSGEFGPVVLVLAYTGLRWGELAALKVGRVDLTRRRIDVVENVVDIGGRLTWGSPKSHESRSVPFPAFLGPVLQRAVSGKGPGEIVFVGARGGVLRHNVERRRHFDPAVTLAGNAVKRLQAGIGMTEGEIDGVFGPGTVEALRSWQGSQHLPVTGRAGREEWRAISAGSTKPGHEALLGIDLGIGARDFPRLTPHDLRHTAASLAVSAGANVKAIQRMLGHASAAMTLDTYADLFDDDLDAVALALDQAASQQGVGKMWAAAPESP